MDEQFIRGVKAQLRLAVHDDLIQDPTSGSGRMLLYRMVDAGSGACNEELRVDEHVIYGAKAQLRLARPTSCAAWCTSWPTPTTPCATTW